MLGVIAVLFLACSIGAFGWSISQWSPKRKAEAARIEEQTRLGVIEREAWIENELPRIQATWGKVLQGLFVATGIVLVALGLYLMVTWAINAQAKLKACRQLPAWQPLPRNRPILLPEGMIYHTGHGGTDIWSEIGEADTGRLLAAGEADAVRARAIVEALSRVGSPSHPQVRALQWAKYQLHGGGETKPARTII